mmetsp:Transcript_121856/g.344635  ORF Transcript_121856/g.344635 Transcript_121856/m.344635 type:complete len:247 (-) Transcript_121856:308-1048(-)
MESLVAVKDGDGFCDGGFLVGTEHVPLLVVLRLRRTHGLQISQEVFGRAFLVSSLGQLLSLRGKITIVGAQQRLLLVVRRGHAGVLLRFCCDELVMRLDGCSLSAPGLFEVRSEGVPHLLQNADDLSGLRSVRASERRLHEGLYFHALGRGEERARREQCLLHARPELHQRRAARGVGRHEPCVVCSRGLLQALVATDRCQDVDGLLELIKRGGHILLLRIEGQLFPSTKCHSLGPCLFVRGDVRL